MSTIHTHIANATGELDDLKSMISSAVEKSVKIAEKDLDINQIDIFFVSASESIIPEYGIGGRTPGPNHIYLTLDPDSDLLSEDHLVETLLHEMHHAMRWRSSGYGITLGEAMVSEGLACMYESVYRGTVPIYARTAIPQSQIDQAKKLLDTNDSWLEHDRWFYGSDDIVRWFGYTYGYRICREYADKNNLTAAEMVGIDPRLILAREQ